MKICVVAYKFGNEKEIGEHLGFYHYFIEKMRCLVRKGHEVCVVCPYLSFIEKGSIDVSGVKVVRYWPPMLNILWLFPINRLMRWVYLKQTQRHVLKTVKSIKPDFIYIWQARETGFAISQIKEKLKVPFIFHQITAWYWHFERSSKDIFGKRKWYKLANNIGLGSAMDKILEFLLDKRSQLHYAKTIYEKADKIIFLSKAAIEEGRKFGLDTSKTCDLGVAIEEDIFRPQGEKLQLRNNLGIKGDKVILFIGRINFDEKGIGYLLEAMPCIVEKIPRVNLVIIGGGGERKRMDVLIQQLGIKNNVQTVGKKPNSLLPKYINASDVLAVPSVWMEAFGKVTIEAMSCGVPVITTDVGASPEININGETGFVIPARNSQAIVDAIVKILSDDGLRKKMGEAARRRVLENYTYDAIINKFLKIIQSTP